MKATQILTEEHKIILKALDCLEKFVLESKAQNELDAAIAEIFFDFIENFADKTHHSKEEDLLFIAMNKYGLSMEMGPIAVMLEEHEQGRNCVLGMKDALESSNIEGFSVNATNFIGMLRNHIYKEDNILYPMANNSFPESESTKLLNDFHEVEALNGNIRIRNFYNLAKNLCKKYEVPFLADSEIPNLKSEFL
ncbi:MAG: hemerythrin [Calditrichaeota bacterium]|nr:MAG: hemerythrin [Calditrichota bacterium]